MNGVIIVDFMILVSFYYGMFTFYSIRMTILSLYIQFCLKRQWMLCFLNKDTSMPLEFSKGKFCLGWSAIQTICIIFIWKYANYLYITNIMDGYAWNVNYFWIYVHLGPGLEGSFMEHATWRIIVTTI